ncbi:MAG: hypothetical protein V3R32_04000 [Nitrosomonadaceae bacterium]
MQTHADIGYSIRNQIRGHVSTDDERIDIEHVFKLMYDVRATLLKEEYEKNKKTNFNSFSSECCLNVVCKEIECDGIKSGDTEYTVTIPRLLDALGRDAIKYFGTVDKKNNFQYLSYQGFQHSGASTYTGNVPGYSIIGETIYLKNLPTDALKYVCMIAIFEKPLILCKPEDPFPMGEHLIHKLQLLVIKQLLSTFGINPDEYNDAKDTPPMPPTEKPMVPGQRPQQQKRG